MSSGTQAAAVARLTLRTSVTRGRLAALAALAAALVAITAVLGRSGEFGQPFDAIDNFTIQLLVPITALLFATAAIGDLVEDQTLVYLWLRPINRGATAVAVTAAALAATLAVVVPIALVAALAGGAETDLLVATVVATVFGVLAYVPLFVALGARVPRALLWGLAFVLIWEAVIANAVDGLARVSVRAYTRSILTEGADVRTDAWTTGTATAVIVLIAFGLLGLAITWRTLRTRDIP